MQNYKLYSISSYSTLSISFKTGCSIQRDYLKFSLKGMIQKFPSILETSKEKMVSGFLKSSKSPGRKECTNRCFQHFGNKMQQTLIMPLASCTDVLLATVEYNGITEVQTRMFSQCWHSCFTFPGKKRKATFCLTLQKLYFFFWGGDQLLLPRKWILSKHFQKTLGLSSSSAGINMVTLTVPIA